jgi:DNA-binding GntR family transcriptional regulator
MVGCAKQHLMIAEAVRDRKPDDADRLMREHIHKVATNVISSMAKAGASEGD